MPAPPSSIPSSDVTSSRRSYSTKGSSEGAPFVDVPRVRCYPLLSPFTTKMRSRSLPAHSCAITCRDPLWCTHVYICIYVVSLRHPCTATTWNRVRGSQERSTAGHVSSLAPFGKLASATKLLIPSQYTCKHVYVGVTRDVCSISFPSLLLAASTVLYQPQSALRSN